eukprot:1161287-Pelagomonas_calceolata.AAC.6
MIADVLSLVTCFRLLDACAAVRPHIGVMTQAQAWLVDAKAQLLQKERRGLVESGRRANTLFITKGMHYKSSVQMHRYQGGGAAQ